MTSQTADLIEAQLAELDDAVLYAILDSATDQCADLAERPGQEARTMYIVLGLIAAAAESALLARQGARI